MSRSSLSSAGTRRSGPTRGTRGAGKGSSAAVYRTAPKRGVGLAPAAFPGEGGLQGGGAWRDESEGGPPGRVGDAAGPPRARLADRRLALVAGRRRHRRRGDGRPPRRRRARRDDHRRDRTPSRSSSCRWGSSSSSRASRRSSSAWATSPARAATRWYGLAVAAATQARRARRDARSCPPRSRARRTRPTCAPLMEGYLAVRLLSAGAVVGLEALGELLRRARRTRACRCVASLAAMVLNVGGNWRPHRRPARRARPRRARRRARERARDVAPPSSGSSRVFVREGRRARRAGGSRARELRRLLRFGAAVRPQLVLRVRRVRASS